MNVPEELLRAKRLPIRPDWLALRDEDALLPAQQIVDAHHHLWEGAAGRYLLDDLQDDIGSGHDVAATVYLQCEAMYRTGGPEELRPIGETEFAAGIAAQSETGRRGPTRVCAGIVGYADLRLIEIGAVLDAHVEAGGGRFRGVRNLAVWHADPAAHGSVANPPRGLLLHPELRRNVANLNTMNLVFETFTYHTQLPEVVELARGADKTTIVLDHLSAPIGIGPYAGRRQEVFAEWAKSIAALAVLPNVYVKLGGLGQKMFGFDFHERALPPTSHELATAWTPYIEHCIAAFGPKRCMFESNFPIDKGTCSYNVLWNAFKRITEGYTAEERRDLFSATAARVYRLSLP